MEHAAQILASVIAVTTAGLAAAPTRATETGSAAPVHRIVLPGGTVLLVEQIPGSPTVGLQAVFPGGTRAEDDGSCGIHALLARLLGATARPGDLSPSEPPAGSPAWLRGFSGSSSFGLAAEFPRERWREGLVLAAESLSPPLGEREVQRERDELLSAIRKREEDPDAAALDAFLGALYRAHPYRLPALGRMSAVADLRAPRLREFYARAARPERLVVAVVGDLDPAAVAEAFRPRLPTAPKTAPAPPPAVPLEPPPDAARVRAVARAIPRTSLVVGFAGLTVRDAGRGALGLAQALLEGPEGRLALRLRAAGIDAAGLGLLRLDGIEPGFFAVAASVAPGQAELAARTILATLRELAEAPPPAEELARAREQVLSAENEARRRAPARAAELAYRELFGLADGAGDGSDAGSSRITAEDISRLARRLFVDSAPVIATVGPDASLPPRAAGKRP